MRDKKRLKKAIKILNELYDDYQFDYFMEKKIAKVLDKIDPLKKEEK